MARSGQIIRRISGLVYTLTNKMTYLCYLLRKGDNTKLAWLAISIIRYLLNYSNLLIFFAARSGRLIGRISVLAYTFANKMTVTHRSFIDFAS